MKRAGIEGIYLGGWATSAKGSTTEDPGPDLASYPLSQVPDEAAGLVRALLTADRNQHFARVAHEPRPSATRPPRSTSARSSSPTPTPATAATPTCATSIRRFVEVGVPGYHIEDQKPGAKKCGHQGGKVLVAERRADQAPQRRPLPAGHHGRARASSSPAPTPRRRPCSTAAATSATSRSSSAPPTSTCRPTRPATWRSCGSSTPLGVDELNGHLLYAISRRGVRRGRRLARAAGRGGDARRGGRSAYKTGGRPRRRGARHASRRASSRPGRPRPA